MTEIINRDRGTETKKQMNRKKEVQSGREADLEIGRHQNVRPKDRQTDRLRTRHGQLNRDRYSNRERKGNRKMQSKVIGQRHTMRGRQKAGRQCPSHRRIDKVNCRQAEGWRDGEVKEGRRERKTHTMKTAT